MKKLTVLMSLVGVLGINAIAGEGISMAPDIPFITRPDSAAVYAQTGHLTAWLNDIPRDALAFYSDSYVSFELVTSESKLPRNWSADTLEFGMYSISTDTREVSETFTVTDSSGTSGSFSEMVSGGSSDSKYGDVVGFTLSNGNKEVTNVKGMGNAVAASAHTKDGDLYIGFYVTSFLGIPTGEITYRVSISGSAPGGGPANGQPLPGVLVTMALGAGVFGIRRKRLSRS